MLRCLFVSILVLGFGTWPGFGQCTISSCKDSEDRIFTELRENDKSIQSRIEMIEKKLDSVFKVIGEISQGNAKSNDIKGMSKSYYNKEFPYACHNAAFIGRGAVVINCSG